MWNFTEFTRCSNASRWDFADTLIYPKYFTIQKGSLKGKGSVTLPFFTLNTKNIAEISEEEDYTFPEASESERLLCLTQSLRNNGYRMITWGPKGNCHYCEFSGGGDLIVTKDSSVLSVVVPQDLPATGEDQQADNEDQQASDEDQQASEEFIYILYIGQETLNSYRSHGDHRYLASFRLFKVKHNI